MSESAIWYDGRSEEGEDDESDSDSTDSSDEFFFSTMPRIGYTTLPFVASPRLGTGMGVLSMSGDAHGVMSKMFDAREDERRITAKGLRASRGDAERAIAAKGAQWAALRETQYRVTAERAADVLRGFGQEWIVFQFGTAVSLMDGSSPLRSFEEIAEAYHDYPFRRVLDDPHAGVMECCLRTMALSDPTVREKASRGVKQLLHDGYPTPGSNGDRYVFVPRRDVGVVWVIDEHETLASHKTRPSSDEVRALLGYTLTDATSKKIPTIDDPTFDERLKRGPLTIAILDEASAPDRVAAYRVASDQGMENRRLDYMFPVPIALISVDGKTTLF